MPGNHRSGGQPKLTAEHKAAGTYQPCRHGNRLDNVVTSERPTKPEGLSPDSSKLWDEVVDYLLGKNVVDVIDATELEMMCRLWGLTRAALVAAEKNPVDKDCRIAACSYAARFEAVASRFGMTPVDRSRLTMRVEEKVTDKSRLFKVCG